MTATHNGSRIQQLFPLSDHFPLSESNALSAGSDSVRPFGLQFATPIKASWPVDMADVTYDDEHQVSTVTRGRKRIPLIQTAMPLTVTSTGSVGSPNYDEIFDKN